MVVTYQTRSHFILASNSNHFLSGFPNEKADLCTWTEKVSALCIDMGGFSAGRMPWLWLRWSHIVEQFGSEVKVYSVS